MRTALSTSEPTGGTSASAPLREIAEDSVSSSEGIDIALASDARMPQGHLPLHPRRQGVLGPEPHALMRGISSPLREGLFYNP